MKRCARATCFLIAFAGSPAAFADDPTPPPTPPPPPAGTASYSDPTAEFLHKATMAPDALLNYVQLTPAERSKYRFYRRHMNETQRLEYLRRVRAEDREQYARDLGLPQLLDSVPEATRASVQEGRIDLGMTPDQVALALGDPAGKIAGAGTLFGRAYKSWQKWSYQRESGPFAVWFGEGVVIGFDRDTSPPADETLPPVSEPKPSPRSP